MTNEIKELQFELREVAKNLGLPDDAANRVADLDVRFGADPDAEPGAEAVDDPFLAADEGIAT